MPDLISMQTDGIRCPFWVRSREARCGSHELVDGRWCKRHTAAIARQLAKEAADRMVQQLSRDDRDRARLVPRLPEMRARMAAAEAELERRTAPVTRDTAAYGGKGCAAAHRDTARRLSDTNVDRVLELERTIKRLAADIGRAEALEES
jgi:hypothetical protein